MINIYYTDKNQVKRIISSGIIYVESPLFGLVLRWTQSRQLNCLPVRSVGMITKSADLDGLFHWMCKEFIFQLLSLHQLYVVKSKTKIRKTVVVLPLCFTYSEFYVFISVQTTCSINVLNIHFHRLRGRPPSPQGKPHSFL
jgi:hypothetical protein